MEGSCAHINWIAVIVSSLSAFVLGFLWYSVLFRKIWVKEVGMTDDKMRSGNMFLTFGTTFVLQVIVSIGLAVFIGKGSSLLGGIEKGLMVGLCWVATSIGVNYLFAMKSFKLYLIDAGYFVVFFTIIGAILGAWS